MKATALLYNWHRFGQKIIGEIYGDTKGRFKDGELIRTSTVERFDGDLVFTRNSVYKLGKELRYV